LVVKSGSSAVPSKHSVPAGQTYVVVREAVVVVLSGQ
jgi:hypothetical protein